MLVEWFPINNTHDVVDGYTIMWKHKGHSQNRTINGSATSSVIAGLRKFTNYTVKVAAYNSIGLGPYTDVKSVLTEPDGELVQIVTTGCLIKLYLCYFVIIS